jgi:glutamine cyclotransferase
MSGARKRMGVKIYGGQPALLISLLVLCSCTHQPKTSTTSLSPEPVSLRPVKVLPVTLSGTPLDSLNELEYIKGYLYANRYLQNYIVKIDPANGKVLAKLDLTSLVEEERNKNAATDVLNGIAYNPETDKIYVTGKLWAGIYDIDFSH